MKERVVAAQMYTVREFCKDLEGVKTSMEKVAEIGYTAVQVSGFGDVSAREVGKIAADNGLTIASSHMNWERFMTDLDGIIEEHQIWNCKHPAIGGIFRGYEGVEGVKRFLDDLAPPNWPRSGWTFPTTTTATSLPGTMARPGSR
jgi:hypothetical protein